ncbi:MAG: efflux RND transporter permease subunit, partial [Methylococcales bacterium]|nr:efflux RND transporter permease subunit [Methylococcales bacterium]
MLAFLVRSSIRFYSVIIALSVILLAYGSYRLSTAGLDIFPEFAPKQVIIQTEAPGFSAAQVEIQVSTPIETALSGLMGLTTTRSESIQGLSIVTALFNENSDIYRNRQQVTERLASLKGRLPATVQMPVPVPLSSSSATVLTLGLSSAQQNLMTLRTLVDWTLVPKILTVPGVADVNVFGGALKQLQIQINPEPLHRYGLSVNDITEAVRKAVHTAQAGFIENTNQRFTLNISGLPQRPEQLKKIVIKTIEGQPLLLSEVATVAYAPAPAIGAAQVGGKEGIVLMVIGQYGANTLSVSKAVEKALLEFKPLFAQQNIDFHNPLFRPADYIETSLSNITSHLLLGSFFVVLVLYLFLYNSRSALIAAIALPLSLIMAAVVLLEAGVNLNIMVLGGLAIALGEVVDDAIIDTENIFRRLKENKLSNNPQSTFTVIYNASMEVRSSVVYASFIVALAFVPLLTLDGVAGRLFAPLGIAYISAILISLLVALTLTPALCYWLLRNTTPTEKKSPVMLFIQPHYQRLLSRISLHAQRIIIFSITACLIGSLVLLNLGTKFLPELREGHY